MQFIKADTSTKVVIGPVVAVGDGFTPVTTLSVSTADEAELLKHDAAAVTSISGNTFAAITSADGYYNLTLTAAQLDTEGRLTVLINDDSLCLPTRADFMVVNANVYDSLYAAAATDYLQVDQLQLGGSTQSATDLKDFADAGYDPATNKVQGVVLVDTTTTNTDMRGTDSALLAASAPTNFGDLAITVTTGQVTVGTNNDKTGYTASSVTDKTGYSLSSPQTFDLTGSITGNLSGSVGSVTGAVGSVTGAVGSVTGNVGGNVTGSVGSVVGHTPQTGDNFARLGAPAGASVSADIASVQTDTNDIQTRLPAALIGGRMDSDVEAINNNTAAADNLQASALGIVSTTVNDASATTTSFITALTEATDDHYIGRIIVFTSGAVAGQATDITDYAGATKTVTVTALTEAPANGVSFVIV